MKSLPRLSLSFLLISIPAFAGPVLEQSLPTEAADVQMVVNGIAALQAKNALNGKLLRGTHAKGVCVGGEFEIFDIQKLNLDPAVKAKLAKGIYSKPGKYGAQLRFANAKGEIKPDYIPDVRALSFWIDLPAGKFSEKAQRQDFSMNNASTFPINDLHDFALLMKLLSEGPAALTPAEGLNVTATLAKGAAQELQIVQPYQQMRYWSSVAYAHGDSDAVKYTVVPCSQNEAEWLDLTNDNFLGDELVRHVNNDKQMSCFAFRLQLLDAENMRDPILFWKRHPASYWVENASADWDENDAPFYTVGMLKLAPKSAISAAACEAFRFNVNKNTLPEHRGLGSINRGRTSAETVSADRRLKPADKQ